MKQITESLAITINASIAPINRQVKNINSGGCGTFAALFAEKMSSLGFEVKIVQLMCYDFITALLGDFSDVEQKVSQNNKLIHEVVEKNSQPNNINLPDHFCVKIGNYYFDSKDFGTSEEDIVTLGSDQFKAIGELPVNDLDYLSLQNRGNLWNKKYNQSDNKKIKSFLDTALSFLA